MSCFVFSSICFIAKEYPAKKVTGKQKRIEVELWQKRKKIIWRRIDNIRNMLERDEEGTSNSNNQQPPEREQDLEMQRRDGKETMSSDSDQTIAVPAINFKRYLLVTSVGYFQMGTASRV